MSINEIYIVTANVFFNDYRNYFGICENIVLHRIIAQKWLNDLNMRELYSPRRHFWSNVPFIQAMIFLQIAEPV